VRVFSSGWGLILAATGLLAAALTPQEPATFLMVKPGDPAAVPGMADEFLEDMGRYLRGSLERFEGSGLVGTITNDPGEAMRLLEERRPVIAFVPPDFFLGPMATGAIPVAQIPRFGSDGRRWHLVVAKGGPTGVDALAGSRVRRPPGTARNFLERVVLAGLFEGDRRLKLEPSQNLADDAFLMMESDPQAPDALLLSEELRRFFEDDPLLWESLKVVWSSEPVPWDLVVARGEWTTAELEELRESLLKMSEDPLGTRLLELMDSTGFTLIEEELLEETARALGDPAGDGP